MKDIKNKIALPFKVIKTNVSGGFIDKVHSEFSDDIDIVNMHEDVLNNYFEANLQSPFTSQWVGGKTHRHTPINDGEDRSENRPEAWHLEFSPEKIKFYSHAYRNSPPAYWTREEYSKRPLNIKNIKSSGSLLAGNFTENYQVLQTSGRRISNNLIVDGFEASGVLTTQFIRDTEEKETILFEDFSSFSIGSIVDTVELVATPNSETTNTVVRERTIDEVGKKYVVFNSSLYDVYPNKPTRSLKLKTSFVGKNLFSYKAIKNNNIGNSPTDKYDPSGLNLQGPNLGRDLVIQYSFDDINWNTYQTILQGSDTSGTGTTEVENNIIIDFSAPYYVRFYQTDHDGNLQDNYAITNVKVQSVTLIPTSVYTLPELNKISGSRSVIVERFNAPGSKEESSRGALDREGEEMSPNIPLPYRNIKIRQPFYRQLAQHNPQFGSGSTYALLPETGNTETVTIHKVNRNRLVRGDREYFDNGFVSHAIPRTDIQYSWITASATTTAAELGGYQSFKNISTPGSYYNLSHAYDDINFIDGTHYGYFESYLLDSEGFPISLPEGGYILISTGYETLTLDNRFINSIIKNTKSIDKECRTFNTNLQDIIPSYAEVVNNSYTFTSWTSIRGGEHPITIKLRKNNYISTTEDCKNYVDPVVTFKYRPLEHELKVSGEENANYNIKHTYTNNLSSVANKDLIETLYLETEDKPQFYNELYSLYTDDSLDSPLSDFVFYKYKEVVWPKEENASLSKTRKRSVYYLDMSGSSRDGYDRQLGTQRTFWRDQQQNRKRSSTDFGGYTGSMGYSSLLETGSLSFSFNHPLQIADIGNVSYTSEYDSIFIPNINNQKIGLHNSVAILDNLGEEINIGAYQCEVITGSGVNQGQISVMRRYNLKFDPAGEFNHNFVDSYGIHRYKDYEQDIFDIGSFYSNTYYKTYLTSKDHGENPELTIQTDNDEILLNPKLRYIAFVGGGELNTGSQVQDLSFITEDNVLALSENLLTASLLKEDVTFSTLDYGLIRTTEKDSGRKPFFDSYEDYIESVRPVTQDYSTIPEFKISDHIEYYENGNFRLENQKIFIIDGQKEYQSAETETGQKNAQFYKSYLQSDILKRHDKVREENRENSQVKSIKIKVSGVKKLLPYNGFYPQDRSIQLANLYGDYVDENLRGGLYGIEVEDYGNKGDIIEHFMCENATINLEPDCDIFPDEIKIEIDGLTRTIDIQDLSEHIFIDTTESSKSIEILPIEGFEILQPTEMQQIIESGNTLDLVLTDAKTRTCTLTYKLMFAFVNCEAIDPTLEYSIDNISWSAIKSDELLGEVDPGDTIYFKTTEPSEIVKFIFINNVKYELNDDNSLLITGDTTGPGLPVEIQIKTYDVCSKNINFFVSIR